MDHARLAELQGPDSIFSGLSVEDWAEIASRSVQISFVKGKELLVQGDPGDMMLILTEGTARVSMLTAGGREIVLAYAEPGAVLGEIALLDGGERTASVTATSAGSALQLGRNALKDFAASHPEFTWSLMQQLARRLRTADQTIESDRAYASGPRLARYLKRLIRKDSAEKSHRVELSQTELGNFAGMSREHINRQLKSWEESGVISLEQGRVRVLDADMLEDISECEG
ncbi:MULTISPECIES: Crp/Fnr family transcriptional regulator [unclassified Sphingopyxis]|jgi:CRP-like cAMP-binding protein|uniref:Crp/Fnr family transcriptional regulator n=1 Tax=unclassified Sphingopyxis TaxID=2614943 RepID=UPI000731613E|nr:MULTISPECIES: Crp/Fnr family transcriptional regulator [unclassified Sphingopyxis]MBD3733184.1 Crp/Fnr family transcriptional regulator [Sphingopyxis sp.]KTE25425.1 Crp/Fnr family transcriptional regulator [Sphingopyxis sp. H057]KTE53446.1 Crp/Fnr family transcriptional regulator [Sphingopyxis sp. H073]KTE56036.1 Crp/Fnr family transcriptional regulator [Sphingopyxis sp. H071]KTE62849.1 Crp/Fnr family transcriptional regulator [Sphingopyxis sp. H107]